MSFIFGFTFCVYIHACTYMYHVKVAVCHSLSPKQGRQEEIPLTPLAHIKEERVEEEEEEEEEEEMEEEDHWAEENKVWEKQKARKRSPPPLIKHSTSPLIRYCTFT